MAEAEQSDNTFTSHRRPYYHNRPGSSYRGRGRGGRANASVSKALNLFGVRDLREILDRKHQEEEQNNSGPPPDPSYNYLKDPSREDANGHQTRRYHKDYHSDRTSGDEQRGHYFRGSRGRGRGRGTPRENQRYDTEKAAFIQNPINIKVEVVASTGERNCKLDEETKIADIKRIPNYKLRDVRPKNEDNAGREFTDNHRNERGRGRWQRGRRGRGRGERGRGRGQGRYSNRNESDQNQPQQSQTKTAVEVASDENWDNECVESLVQNEEQNERNHEEDYVGNREDHEDGDHEQYYEGDEEEFSEINEQNQSLAETVADDLKLDENLVVTSSENDEKHKRSVTFKLDKKQSDEAANRQPKSEKRDVENKSPQETEGNKREPGDSGK